MRSARRLAAPLLAFMLVLAVVPTLHAAPIAPGTWYVFCFGSGGTFATATGGCSVGPNSSPVGSPPWMITTTGPATVRVTDLYLAGDRFTLRDFGVDLMTTTPTAGVGGCGSDPEACYGAANMSWGSYALGAGTHSFEIYVNASPFGGGAAAFRVDLAADPGVVPEPSTVVLVASGLLGVFGIARRRRRA